MSYHALIERWLNRTDRSSQLSMDYELDAFQHPDFDVPGVLVTTPSGRVMLIVEGEMEYVGPIIEKAHEQFAALGEDAS